MKLLEVEEGTVKSALSRMMTSGSLVSETTYDVTGDIVSIARLRYLPSAAMTTLRNVMLKPGTVPKRCLPHSDCQQAVQIATYKIDRGLEPILVGVISGLPQCDAAARRVKQWLASVYIDSYFNWLI